MESLLTPLLVIKAALIVAWFALLFAMERFYPATERSVTGQPGQLVDQRRLLRNLCLWLLNTLLWPLAVLPVTLWAVNHQPDLFGQTGNYWLLLHILILDLWLYWWHRANHEWSLLWRFHRIHHLDNWLDTTTAVRFHFGELFLSAIVRAVVVLALGVTLEAVLVYETLVLVVTLFHHSNIRLRALLEKSLSRLIITPGIHWVHHHAVRKDTDSNYGTLFSFWDQLFSTRSRTVRFAGMPIGLNGEKDRRLEYLLSAPFHSDA